MKISLVFARMKYKTGDPPGGLALIAAHLRNNGYSVDLIDSTFHRTMDYIRKRIDDFDADYVAIYCDSLMLNDVKKIAKYAKSKGKKVIIGGPQATLRPETLTEFSDFVVKGEAESAMLDILKGKCKEKIIQGERFDLENLPIMAYDLLDMEDYIKLWHVFDSIDPNVRGTNMFSSRGCPFRCTFCQPVLEKIFGKGVRTRSVDSVIEEMKHLKNHFGINAIWFNDDTFTVRKEWIKVFCKRLVDEELEMQWGINSRIGLLNEEEMRMMYAAGLRIMHVGVETGSQRVADEIYHKDIDLSKVHGDVAMAEKVGIRCLCYIMLGAPGETKEEILQTIKFAKSLDATEITATITTPLPETHLYESMKGKYKLTENYDYYKNRIFEDENISFSELKFLQKRLLFEFYTHPKRWGYVAKHLTSVQGLHKMYLKVMRFM